MLACVRLNNWLTFAYPVAKTLPAVSKLPTLAVNVIFAQPEATKLAWVLILPEADTVTVDTSAFDTKFAPVTFALEVT